MELEPLHVIAEKSTEVPCIDTQDMKKNENRLQKWVYFNK